MFGFSLFASVWFIRPLLKMFPVLKRLLPKPRLSCIMSYLLSAMSYFNTDFNTKVNFPFQCDLLIFLIFWAWSYFASFLCLSFEKLAVPKLLSTILSPCISTGYISLNNIDTRQAVRFLKAKLHSKLTFCCSPYLRILKFMKVAGSERACQAPGKTDRPGPDFKYQVMLLLFAYSTVYFSGLNLLETFGHRKYLSIPQFYWQPWKVADETET